MLSTTACGRDRRDRDSVADAAIEAPEPPQTLDDATVGHDAVPVEADAETSPDATTSTLQDAWVPDAGGEAVDSSLRDAEKREDTGSPECSVGAQQQRLRYQEAAPTYRVGCISETQTRACLNGSWASWSGSYGAETCTPRPPAACDGTESGGSRTREHYQAALVPFGRSCVKETQSQQCSDGGWTEWSGEFQFAACDVAPPEKCGNQGQGARRTQTRYHAKEVFNVACVPEEQESFCDNGTWGPWSGTASETSCSRCNDADGDKHGTGCSAGLDCNDSEPRAYSGAAEVEWNAVDENCDGQRGRRFEMVKSFAGRHLSSTKQVMVDREHVVMLADNMIEVRKVGAFDTSVLKSRAFGLMSTEKLRVYGNAGIEERASVLQLRQGTLVGIRTPTLGRAQVVLYDFDDFTKVPIERGVLELHETGDYLVSFHLSLDGKRLYTTETVGAAPNAVTATRLHDVSDRAHPVLRQGFRAPCHAHELSDDNQHVIASCYDGSTSSTQVADVPAANAAFVWRNVNGNIYRLDGFQQHGILRAGAGGDLLGYLYTLDLAGNAPLVQPLGGSYRRKDFQDETPVRTSKGVYYLSEDNMCGTACWPIGAGGTFLRATSNHVIAGMGSELADYALSTDGTPLKVGTWRNLQVSMRAPGAIEDNRLYMGLYDGLVVVDLAGTIGEPLAAYPWNGDEDFQDREYVRMGPDRLNVQNKVVYAYDRSWPVSIPLVDFSAPSAPTRLLTVGAHRIAPAKRGTRRFLVYTAPYWDMNYFRWSRIEGNGQLTQLGERFYDPGAATLGIQSIRDDGAYTYVQQGGTVFVDAFDGTSMTRKHSFSASEFFVIRDAGIYRLGGSGFALEIFDRDSGALLASHAFEPPGWSPGSVWQLDPSAPYLFISASASDGMHRLDQTLVYDLAAQTFAPVEFPFDASACRFIAAGEGTLACAASEPGELAHYRTATELRVLRVVQ